MPSRNAVPTGQRNSVAIWQTLSAFLLAALCVFWALDPQTMFGFAIYREQFLSLVLGLTLSTCYLTVTVRRRAAQRLAWYDAVAAFVGLAMAIWMSWHWERLLIAVGDQTNEVLISARSWSVLVMEGLRRVTGLPLFIVVIVFIAYAFVGDQVPGELKALAGQRSEQLMIYLAFDPTSVFGTPFTIGAQVVVIFIFLGQLMLKTHGGEFFTDLAMATMGRQRGGAAKVAVVASALFGSISGSATSNVASTGVLTIPLMRSTGYSAVEAGAIEAVASTGGQFMPPIMGAAAFLMAEFLEIAYAKVVIAAIVPALLYYFAVFIQVDLLAARRGINVVEQDIPRARTVLKDGWHFIVPFALLLYVLFELLRSAQEAAVWATGAIIVLGMVFSYKGTRLRPWQIVEAFIETGRISVELLLILGAAGFVIGVLNITGLGFALTFFLIHLGGSSEMSAADHCRHRLHRSRHGHADLGRLCLACRADRAGVGASRGAATGGAHVHSLFRHDVDDHAADRAGGLCRSGAHQGERHEHRFRRDATRLGRLHHSVSCSSSHRAFC